MGVGGELGATVTGLGDTELGRVAIATPRVRVVRGLMVLAVTG